MTSRKATPSVSVFDRYAAQAWPNTFRCKITVGELHGGVPFDPAKALGWIKSKVEESDDIIADMVADAIASAPLTEGEAQAHAAKLKTLTGFRRSIPDGYLYVPGYHIKALLKEGASVAVSGGHLAQKGWGKLSGLDPKGKAVVSAPGKALSGYFPEHVFVTEDEIFLTKDGVRLTEPDDIHTRFCHTWNSNSIKNEETCFDVDLEFTIRSDAPFTERDWAMIWLAAEEQGLGTARSQGFGRFKVVEWSKLS